MPIEFNLPGSSFDEVQKILKGYGNAHDDDSLGDLSKLIGLHPTIISRNNKFLVDIGLIEGGRTKHATELGKKLGRALEHTQIQDAQGYWKDAVQTNDKVSGLVTTVRIKGGMTEKEFCNHVLYVSGQKNTAGNKTGARCVTEVLIAAGLLHEDGGNLSVATPQADNAPIDSGNPASNVARTKTSASNPNNDRAERSVPPAPSVAVGASLAFGTTPQIAINIQLQLPETENAEVYEKLFKALRENLLCPKE